MKEPYENCPILETESFILRLVSEDDALDLLDCYSDPKSQKIFNSENCANDFCYNTVDEMRACIRFWLKEYSQKMYVRFSVIDKEIQKPIGTVEMFSTEGFFNDYDGGILRIDLASKYETSIYISEILGLANNSFYSLFGADMIVTKGSPTEENRVHALLSAGYQPYDRKSPRKDFYYSRIRD